MRWMTGLLTLFLCSPFLSCQEVTAPADLILTNGEIYTMESDQPWAGAVVVTGNEITAVLEDGQEIDAYVGDNTRVIKPGKLADFTVTDLNLMEIDPADVLKMNIEMTIVDGKVVYDR